jgi:putative DNA primase/helicase
MPRTQKPKTPRNFYADTTPEELAFSLSQHWPVGGILSSEAGLVFGGHSMNHDTAMRTFSLFNILWDGAKFQVDRRTSESFSIECARLTIVLQVQEATLREFIRKTGSLARGTGFFARFLICWPESTQGYRFFSEPPKIMYAVNRFNDRLYSILKQGQTIDERGTLAPHILSLSLEAKQSWIAFHDEIERQLVSGGQYQNIRDVASKIADNAARLAGLFHVFEGVPGPISLQALNASKLVLKWHLDESNRFFSELSLPQELSDAVRLERWMIEICLRHKTTFIRKNDMRQRGPVRSKQFLQPAIDELITLNRIRVGKEGRAEVIYINPSLILPAAA